MIKAVKIPSVSENRKKLQCALKATGHCFDNCGSWFMNHPEYHDRVVLVHATVTGAPGSEIEGIEFDHAFLILDDTIALDMTRNDERFVVMNLDAYRERGRVRDEKFYTYGQLLANVQEHKHWGPWT